MAELVTTGIWSVEPAKGKAFIEGWGAFGEGSGPHAGPRAHCGSGDGGE